MDRTDFLPGQLFFWEELFARAAVMALVGTSVDIPACFKCSEEFPDPALVHLARCAEKNVVRDVQPLPKFCERRCHLIAVVLRREAFVLGSFMHIRTMFIDTGEEEHIVSLEPMIPRQDIGGDGGVGVPGVRFAVDVVNGGGDVKCSHH